MSVIKDNRIFSCYRNAATKWKLGKDVLRSVVVTNDPLIEYEGSKDALEMYTKDQSYFSNTAFSAFLRAASFNAFASTIASSNSEDIKITPNPP